MVRRELDSFESNVLENSNFSSCKFYSRKIDSGDGVRVRGNETIESTGVSPALFVPFREACAAADSGGDLNTMIFLFDITVVRFFPGSTELIRWKPITLCYASK